MVWVVSQVVKGRTTVLVRLSAIPTAEQKECTCAAEVGAGRRSARRPVASSVKARVSCLEACIGLTIS